MITIMSDYYFFSSLIGMQAEIIIALLASYLWGYSCKRSFTEFYIGETLV